MSVDEARPLEQAVNEKMGFVRAALQRAAPVKGLVDLPPFDHIVGDLTGAQRRQIVLEQLPTPIPLTIRGERQPERLTPARRSRWCRQAALWVLFALAVTLVAVPAMSLAFGVFWLIVLLWPGNRRREEVRDASGSAMPRGEAVGLDLRIIWMARFQVAEIARTRSWGSDELTGVNRIDVFQSLQNLTDRALSLHRFASTSPPQPSRTQPELRRQWQREQERIDTVRTALIEQVAALIVYREHLDLVSDLMDQRDHMALLSARAAAFDEALPPSADGPVLLDAAEQQRELHANLASQIRYLGDIADNAETGLPLGGTGRNP